MRERNRRQCCRLAFIALCVGPSFAAFSWSAYRMSPLYAAAEKAVWERALFDRTGLIAALDHVEHPAGGSTLLVGIELTDPDGGDRVARLRQAEFAKTPQGMVVLLSQPEIARGKFLRLWDVLHDRVLRGPQADAPVQITTGELTLEVGLRAQTFTLLRCTLEPHATGVRAQVEFQVAGLEMPAPASLRIERNRQTVPPSTRWQLDTATPVPCALFADYLPGLSRLGTGCTFQGTIAATGLRETWSAELAGRFSQVDLEAATEPFAHRVSGLAHVTVRRALVRGGVLAEAAGEVVCGGGTVSTSLLQSCVENLQIVIPSGASHVPQQNIPYMEMAFDFALESSGMMLNGRCASGAHGTILNSSSGELLVGDPRRTYPLVALIRALSPDSDWLVPATDESKDLLRVLALPSRQRNVDTLARQPRVRMRLREQTDNQ